MENTKTKNPRMQNFDGMHASDAYKSDDFVSLRDDFAGKAMQGILANLSESQVGLKFVLQELGLPSETKYNFFEHYPKYVSKLSYAYADAMLKQREL